MIVGIFAPGVIVGPEYMAIPPGQEEFTFGGW